MENLIQKLERDIPKAEERLGSDARIVREMRRQLAGLKAEGKLRDQLVFPSPAKAEIEEDGLVTRRRHLSETNLNSTQKQLAISCAD